MFLKYMHLERYGNEEVDGIEKATNEMFLDKRDIPRLLQTVFYDLINEELWNIIKKHKNPKIDFAYLQRLTITKVKEKRKDIF